MKNHTTLAICFLLVLLAAVLFAVHRGVLLIKHAHDAAGEAEIREVIPVLEELRARTGKYPTTIEGIRTKIRMLWILPPPQLEYRNTDKGYKIAFYGFPLGPSWGYDSEKREWYAEE